MLHKVLRKKIKNEEDEKYCFSSHDLPLLTEANANANAIFVF